MGVVLILPHQGSCPQSPTPYIAIREPTQGVKLNSIYLSIYLPNHAMGIVYEVMYKRVYLKPTPGGFETDTCEFETDAPHFSLT